ncbi:MAG: MFS transporter [Streptosporangiaceae bacterium]
MIVEAPRRNRRSDSLLRSHRGFRLLFAADAISRTGSQITLVALPLTAILMLHASAQQVGILVALGTSAFLIAALPVGVWVDRLRRRPVMVAADLIRLLLLASVPVAATFGVLSLTQLYVVALLTGFGNVFFDVAQQSYVSHLLGDDRLIDGFSKLEMVANGSMLTGPSAGGVLVALVTAPGAIAVDAISYLASAALLVGIQPREPDAHRSGERSRLHREISVGLRYVTGHPVLRLIALNGMTGLLFEYALLTLQPLLLVRALGLHPAVYGLVTGGIAIGGVVGSVLANRVIAKLGIARSLWLPLVVTCPLLLVMPLVSHGWQVVPYPLGYTVFMFGLAFQNVAQVSYRQAICPPELRGRMNATMRFLTWGMMPLGALLGGFVAQAAGVWVALWVCVIGMMASIAPMLAKPVRRLSRDARWRGTMWARSAGGLLGTVQATGATTQGCTGATTQGREQVMASNVGSGPDGGV